MSKVFCRASKKSKIQLFGGMSIIEMTDKFLFLHCKYRFAGDHILSKYNCSNSSADLVRYIL